MVGSGRRGVVIGLAGAAVGFVGGPVAPLVGDDAAASRNGVVFTPPHIEYRRAFEAWLLGNAHRFAVPIRVGAVQPGILYCGFPVLPQERDLIKPMTELHLAGVHPDIRVTLDSDFVIHMAERHVWQPLYTACSTPIAVGKRGWADVLAWPDERIVYRTPFGVWQAGMFERILSWINTVLAPATHLVFWHWDDGSIRNWNFVRNDVILGTDIPLSSCDERQELLRLHGWPT